MKTLHSLYVICLVGMLSLFGRDISAAPSNSAEVGRSTPSTNVEMSISPESGNADQASSQPHTSYFMEERVMNLYCTLTCGKKGEIVDTHQFNPTALKGAMLARYTIFKALCTSRYGTGKMDEIGLTRDYRSIDKLKSYPTEAPDCSESNS